MSTMPLSLPSKKISPLPEICSYRCFRIVLCLGIFIESSTSFTFTHHQFTSPALSSSSFLFPPSSISPRKPAPSIASSLFQSHSISPSLQQSPSIVTSAVLDSPSEMADFQRRMRDTMVTDDSSRRSISQHSKRRSRANQSIIPANYCVVRTLQEFKEIVADEEEKIVVVRFFATWCKSCKAIAPSFQRLTKMYPQALFVDVPVTQENSNLHQGLEVPSLPFGHIYDPRGGLVEESKISKKHFGAFAKIVKSYVIGECELIDESVSNPYVTKHKKVIMPAMFQ